MSLLARRNLFHGRNLFAFALAGIAFALILIISCQFGFFLNFTATTSNNIHHSDADLWIVFHSVGYFDTGRIFLEREYREIFNQVNLEARRSIPELTIFRLMAAGIIRACD